MGDNKPSLFERFSNKVTQLTGSSMSFIIAVLIVLVWAATGPIFHYSETWQLVINTGTTIITFLMVFLIQKSQNKDSKAIQLKLNELIASMQGASNRMVNIEDLDETKLDEMHELYMKLSEVAKKNGNSQESASIETAINEIGEKVDNVEEKVDDIGEKVDDLSGKIKNNGNDKSTLTIA